MKKPTVPMMDSVDSVPAVSRRHFLLGVSAVAATAAAADKDRRATTDAIADTARVVADAVGVQEPLGALHDAIIALTAALKAHPSAGPSAPPGP